MGTNPVDHLAALCSAAAAIFKRERELLALGALNELPAFLNAKQQVIDEMKSVQHDAAQEPQRNTSPTQDELQKTLGDLKRSAEDNILLLEQIMSALQDQAGQLKRTAEATMAYVRSRAL